MKIVRKENGNILLTDASGNTIKRLPEYAVLELKRDTEGEFVRVAYGHQNKHDIYVAQITHTQLEPAAELAFSGTGQDLLNLLSTSFFFEVSEGGNAYIYGDNTTQTFLASNFVQMSTVAGIVNELRGYFITIFQDVEILDIRIRISTGVAGNSIFGIYEVDETGYPTSKIFESAIFDNSLTSQQSSAVNQTLSAGTYFVCYNTNSTATFRAFNSQSLYNPASGSQKTISSSTQNSGIRVSYTYTGSLPSNFPLGALDMANANLPSVIFLIA